MPSFGEKFDFSDLAEMACVPVYKILEGNTNPFIMNKNLVQSGDKHWGGVVDGCISQIYTESSAADKIESISFTKLHKTIFTKGYLKGLDATLEVAKTK